MSNTNLTNNYSMEDLMAVIQGTAQNLNMVSESFGIISQKMTNLELSSKSNAEDIRTLSNDFQSYKETQKLNERIDSYEAKELVKMKSKRIYELLDEAFGKNSRGIDDSKAFAKKYFRRLAMKYWSDAKRYSHVAGEYRETKRKWLDDVKEYTETWYPHDVSVSALLDEVDKDIERRKMEKAELLAKALKLTELS